MWMRDVWRPDEGQGLGGHRGDGLRDRVLCKDGGRLESEGTAEFRRRLADVVQDVLSESRLEVGTSVEYES